MNSVTFDGPGQAELWKDVKFVLDYYEPVSAVIDWLFESNDRYAMTAKPLHEADDDK